MSGALFEGHVKWSKQTPSDDGRLDHRAKFVLGAADAGQLQDFMDRWADGKGQLIAELKATKDVTGVQLGCDIVKSEQQPSDEGKPSFLLTLDFGVISNGDLREFFNPWYAGDDETIYLSLEAAQQELDLGPEPELEEDPDAEPAEVPEEADPIPA